MKQTFLKIAAAASIAAFLSGCALFSSDINGLYNIKEAHTRVFDKDISECYGLTKKALAGWGAVEFQQRYNDYIVAMEFEHIFKSCINTTEVGIFFTGDAPHKTEVKVTSLNYNLSQVVSRKLFDYIEKGGKVPVEEEKEPVASSRNPFKNL